jgi:Flp pilus assembly pilin Flp
MKQKGQGLLEYALILILVAVVVIAVISLFWTLVGAWVIAHWPAFLAWGTGLVEGLKSGDPTSIFIAILIIVILWLFFGRRRRR